MTKFKGMTKQQLLRELDKIEIQEELEKLEQMEVKQENKRLDSVIKRNNQTKLFEIERDVENDSLFRGNVGAKTTIQNVITKEVFVFPSMSKACTFLNKPRGSAHVVKEAYLKNEYLTSADGENQYKVLNIESEGN